MRGRRRFGPRSRLIGMRVLRLVSPLVGGREAGADCVAGADWSTSIDERTSVLVRGWRRSLMFLLRSRYQHSPTFHRRRSRACELPPRSTSLTPLQISSISIRSPTFLQEAAAPTGSLGLYVKAVVLLGRVVNFLQRASLSLPCGLVANAFARRSAEAREASGGRVDRVDARDGDYFVRPPPHRSSPTLLILVG